MEVFLLESNIYALTTLRSCLSCLYNFLYYKIYRYIHISLCVTFISTGIRNTCWGRSIALVTLIFKFSSIAGNFCLKLFFGVNSLNQGTNHHVCLRSTYCNWESILIEISGCKGNMNIKKEHIRRMIGDN